MFYFLAGCNLAMAVVFAIKFASMPPQIPLFYSKPWGEEQLADFWMIFLLPVLANGFFFINNYLVGRFFNGNSFAGKLIDFVNVFLILTFTLVFIKIITQVS